jgi:hypothetical protein
MTSLSQGSGESLFFETVEVDVTCLLGLSFLVELNPWSSESNVSRKYDTRMKGEKPVAELT